MGMSEFLFSQLEPAEGRPSLRSTALIQQRLSQAPEHELISEVEELVHVAVYLIRRGHEAAGHALLELARSFTPRLFQLSSEGVEEATSFARVGLGVPPPAGSGLPL